MGGELERLSTICNLHYLGRSGASGASALYKGAPPPRTTPPLPEQREPMFNQIGTRIESILARRDNPRRHRGMTLIEIMVVLVILGLIAGAIGYNVFNQLKVAQIKSAQLDAQKISDCIDIFHTETG